MAGLLDRLNAAEKKYAAEAKKEEEKKRKEQAKKSSIQKANINKMKQPTKSGFSSHDPQQFTPQLKQGIKKAQDNYSVNTAESNARAAQKRDREYIDAARKFLKEGVNPSTANGGSPATRGATMRSMTGEAPKASVGRGGYSLAEYQRLKNRMDSLTPGEVQVFLDDSRKQRQAMEKEYRKAPQAYKGSKTAGSASEYERYSQGRQRVQTFNEIQAIKEQERMYKKWLDGYRYTGKSATGDEDLDDNAYHFKMQNLTPEEASGYIKRYSEAAKDKSLPYSERARYRQIADNYKNIYKDKRFEALKGKADFLEKSKDYKKTYADDRLYPMNEDERRLYTYLYKTEGRKASDEYLKSITPELNRRGREMMLSYDERLGREHPILGTAYTYGLVIPAEMGSGLAYLKAAATGYVDENDPLTFGSQERQQIRQTVSENIDNGVARWAYNTANSTVDSAINMLAGGAVAGAFGAGLSATQYAELTSNIVSGLMSSEAAMTAALEEKRKGSSDRKAVIMGGIQGGIEYLTERWSIENILSDSPKISRQLIKSFVSEGSEEWTGNQAGRIVDLLANGDKNDIQKAYDRYRLQGLGEKGALGKVIWDIVKEDAGTFLAGGLSGLAMSGAGYGKYAALREMENREAGQGYTTEDAKALAEGTIEYFAGKEESVKRAEKIKEKIEKGKTPSAREVGALVNEYERVVAEERAKEGIERKSPDKIEVEDIVEALANNGVENPADVALDIINFKNGAEATERMGDINAREVIARLASRGYFKTDTEETAAVNEEQSRPSEEQMKVSAESRIRSFGENGARAYEIAFENEIDDGYEGSEYAFLYDYSRYYTAALKGMSLKDADERFSSAAISQQAKEAAFSAGIADREENLRTAREQSRQERTGEGKVNYNGFETDDDTKGIIEGIAKRTGTDIEIVYSSGESDGMNPLADTGANGYYYNGKIVLSAEALMSSKSRNKALRFLVGHEATHRIQALAPKDYMKFRDIAMRDADTETIGNEAAKRGITLDEAIDELLADQVGRSGFAERIAREDISLAEKIRNIIRDILDALGIKKYSEQERIVRTWDKAIDKAKRQAEKNSPLSHAGRDSSPTERTGGKVKYSEGGITPEDVKTIQDIAKNYDKDKVSINDLTSEDIKKLEYIAQKYYKEMGVKSPFFRAWFGDWRANDKTPLHIVSEKGSTRRPVKNNDTGWNINVSGKVFNETKSHNQMYNILAKPYLEYIDSIVKNSVLLDSDVISKDKTKSVNSIMMHTLYAVADIGNGKEVLKLYVEELNDVNSDGTIKRSYQLQNITNRQSSDRVQEKSLAPSASTADINTISDLFGFVKQNDKNFSPREASKVVDKEKTPKVMYRGDNEDISIFDRKKSRPSNLYGRGFYFTDSESHAGEYGEPKAYYLNVVDPLSPGQNNITREQMRNFLEAVADNEDDYDIWNYGTTDIDEVLESVWGKGDFEMLQDVSATAIGDLVEATELFNRVNGTHYDGFILPTETVVFDSTQIKSATDNIGTFDKNNPHVRHSKGDIDEIMSDDFKLSKNVEETRDLVAVHNIEPGKFVKSIELGGFAMPSIAVTKASIGHNDFGSISVVFGKDTIDPRINGNKIYSQDAYTPTFPQVQYKASAEKVEEISKIYDDISKRFGRNDARPLYNYIDESNFRNELDRYDGEKGLINHLKTDTDLMQTFFLIKGEEKVEPVTREITEETHEALKEKYDHLIGTLGKEFFENMTPPNGKGSFSYAKEYAEKNREKFENAYKDMISELYGYTDEEIENVIRNEFDTEKLLKEMRECRSYIRTGGKTVRTEVNRAETIDKIREKAKKLNYSKWVEDTFRGAVEKKGIYNGKDPFTPSGKRRSFDELHNEYTLENVVKAMKASGEKGIGAAGTGNIFGASSENYSSIGEMKADAKKRMQRIGTMEFTEKREEYLDRLYDIARSMAMYKNNPRHMSSVEELLVEAVAKNKTARGVANYIRSEGEGWIHYSEEAVKDLIGLVRDIRNMPAAYFEAKPGRAVGIDEIRAVIMPEARSVEDVYMAGKDTFLDDLDTVRKALDEKGIPVLEYEYGNDNDRRDKLNSLDEVKFSKGNIDELMKIRQNDIIQKANPAHDNIHTWIRSANDIKTFAEALGDDEYSYTPDYTREMAEEALKTGKITVYSSYQIENGVFVTPSRMEAKSYAGGGNIYSKTVSLDDVAWINTLEGQYAKTNMKYSTGNIDELMSEGEYIFRPNNLDEEKLNDSIDRWLRGEMRSDESIEFGNTPYVMREIGIEKLPVVMSQDVLVKLSGGKHNVSLDIVRNMPALINDPLMVLDSDTVPGAYVILTEETDKRGRPVVAALHVNKRQKHFTVNRIASVYGKDNANGFIERQAKSGNIRYINDIKIQDRPQSRGLQLPKLADINPVNNSILYKSEIVNRFSEENLRKNSVGNIDELINGTYEGYTEEARRKFLSDLGFTDDFTAPENPSKSQIINATKKFAEGYIGDQKVLRMRVNEAYKQMWEYFRTMSNKKATTDQKNIAWERFDSEAESLAREIIENTMMKKDEEYQNFKEIRKAIKGEKIYIPKDYRNDIDGIGEYNRFRKRNFGKFTLSDSGTAIDVLWEKWHDEFGDIFPSDITHPGDQIKYISNLFDTFQTAYENPYNADLDAALQYKKREIYDVLSIDIMEKGTLTEVNKRISDNRKKAQEALKRLREGKDKEIKYLRETNKRLREGIKKENDEWAKRKQLLHLGRVVEKLKNTRGADEITRERIDSILKDVDLAAVSITGRSINNIKELMIDREREKAAWGGNWIPDEKTEERIRRLSLKQIKDMDINDVQEMIDVLKNIETEIRTRNNAIESEERRDFIKQAMVTTENIRNSKGLSGNIFSKGLDTYIRGTLSPLREMHRITGYAENDPLYNLTKELQKGEAKQIFYEMRANKKFEKWTKDEKFMESIRGKKSFKKYTIKQVNRNGQFLGEAEVELCPNFIIALYLHSKNFQNELHIMEGGINVPDKRLYLKGRFQDAFDKGSRIHLPPEEIARLTKELTPEMIRFADECADYFNNMAKKEMNEQSNKYLGYDIARVKYYFPLHCDPNFLQTAEDEALIYDGTIEGMGILKERVPNAQNPVMLNGIIEELSQSITKHAKYVGLVIPMRNFNMLLRTKLPTFLTTPVPALTHEGYKVIDREGVLGEKGQPVTVKTERFNDWGTSTMDTISNIWMSPTIEYINNFKADLQFGRKDRTGGIWPLINWLQGGYIKATLAMNIPVAVNQAASYTSAIPVLGWKAIARELIDPGKADLKQVEKRSGLLWNRTRGEFDVSVADALRKDTKWNKIMSSPAVNYMADTDALVTRKLWKATVWSVKYDIKKSGEKIEIGSDEFWDKVNEKFEDMMMNTQPNATPMERPGFLRADNATKMALPFSGEPMKNLNIIYDGVNNYFAKARAARQAGFGLEGREKDKAIEKAKAEKKEAAIQARTVIASQMLTMFVYETAVTAARLLFGSKAARRKYEDEEGNLTLKSVGGRMLYDYILSSITQLPFASDIVDAVMAFAKGEQYDGTEVLAVSAFNNGIKMFYSVGSDVAKIQNGDLTDRQMIFAAEKDARMIGTFLGQPVGNFSNIIKGIADNGIKIKYRDDPEMREYMRLMLEKAPAKKTKDDEGNASYKAEEKTLDILYRAFKKGNKDTYNYIVTDLIEQGVKPSEIESAIESRKKKDTSYDPERSLGAYAGTREAIEYQKYEGYIDAAEKKGINVKVLEEGVDIAFSGKKYKQMAGDMERFIDEKGLNEEQAEYFRDMAEKQYKVNELNAEQYLIYSQEREDIGRKIDKELDYEGAEDNKSKDRISTYALEYTEKNALRRASGGDFVIKSKWVNKADEFEKKGYMSAGEFINRYEKYGSAVYSDNAVKMMEKGKDIDTYLEFNKRTSNISGFDLNDDGKNDSYTVMARKLYELERLGVSDDKIWLESAQITDKNIGEVRKVMRQMEEKGALK